MRCCSSPMRKDLAYAVAGKMRNEVGERCDLRDPQAFAFAWVTGFPYLEIDEDDGSSRIRRIIRLPRPRPATGT